MDFLMSGTTGALDATAALTALGFEVVQLPWEMPGEWLSVLDDGSTQTAAAITVIVLRADAEAEAVMV